MSSVTQHSPHDSASPPPSSPPMQTQPQPQPQPPLSARRRSQRDHWSRIRDACERFQRGLGTDVISSARTQTLALVHGWGQPSLTRRAAVCALGPSPSPAAPRPPPFTADEEAAERLHALNLVAVRDDVEALILEHKSLR